MIYNTGKCINVKYENIKILCTLLCHIIFATFLVYHSEGPDVQCNAKQILIPMTSNGLTDIHTSAACPAAMSAPIIKVLISLNLYLIKVNINLWTHDKHFSAIETE